MTHQIVMVTWWFLAMAASGKTPAQAFGPYPTEQMCVAAEHTANTHDERFWTTEFRTKIDAYNRADERRHNWYLALAKANRKVGTYYHLPDGSVFRRTVDGTTGTMGNSNGFQEVCVVGICFANGNGMTPAGKLEPQLPEYPFEHTDWTVQQTCAPVNGWTSVEEK